MAELDLLRVDVFTEELYSGNPANVVLDADSLDEVQMGRIASEAGSPPTAFVLRSKKADLRLRYFASSGEDPLCGHATIGAIWCLSDARAFGGSSGGKQRLETPVGILPFSVEAGPDGPRRVWMGQTRPMFAREGDVKEVASALGTGVDSLFDDKFPLARVSTGLPTLLVSVRSIDSMGKLAPKREEVIALCRELDVAAIEAYTWNVFDQGSTVHVRCFVPSKGEIEDAGSGMPAGALGAYLAENEFIPRDKFEDIVVEQGHWLGRPSRILVRVEKHAGAIRKVEVGGAARISFRARMTVP